MATFLLRHRHQLIKGLHTPFVLRMVLAFYTDADNPPEGMWSGAFTSPIGIKTLEDLEYHDLVKNNAITQAGRDWLKAALSIPFPDTKELINLH